jgi:TATA-binding protein-associated factor Taf7
MGDHGKAATVQYKKQDSCADASEASSSSNESYEESEDNAQSLFKAQESSSEESDNPADDSSGESSDSDSADPESSASCTLVGEFFSVLKRHTLSSIRS